MDRLASALSLSILGAGLAVIGALPADATQRLQGSWDATNAERDGKAAGELVGHRLTLPVASFLSGLRAASAYTQEPPGRVQT